MRRVDLRFCDGPSWGHGHRRAERRSERHPELLVTMRAVGDDLGGRDRHHRETSGAQRRRRSPRPKRLRTPERLNAPPHEMRKKTCIQGPPSTTLVAISQGRQLNCHSRAISRPPGAWREECKGAHDATHLQHRAPGSLRRPKQKQASPECKSKPQHALGQSSLIRKQHMNTDSASRAFS